MIWILFYLTIGLTLAIGLSFQARVGWRETVWRLTVLPFVWLPIIYLLGVLWPLAGSRPAGWDGLSEAETKAKNNNQPIRGCENDL